MYCRYSYAKEALKFKRKFMIPEKDMMIKLLGVLFPEAQIYLLGSQPRGDYKEISDIDLALDDRGRKIDAREIVKAKNILDALNIPQKIDIVDFNSVPERLQKIILKEGVLWKS